jgi:hypothetical protein
MMLSGPQAPSSAGALLSQIKHLGLTRGYADYWTSAPITWISEEHINVYPVIPGCGGDGSLCPYTYASPSWYVPQAQSTFLIVRTPELCPFGDIGRVFGKPQRSVEIDPGTHVLVYSYDIASRFTPKASICF